MHLVGFIVRIYHDARSHERQNIRTNKLFVDIQMQILTHPLSGYSFQDNLPIDHFRT